MADKIYIPKKRSRGDDGFKVISVRMKEGLVGEIDIIAEKTSRSRNELINMLLEYAVKNVKLDEDE